MGHSSKAVHRSVDALRNRYVRFAAVEARGSSRCYEHLALAVSHSPALLSFIENLPEERQQPNLFLAAVRSVAGVPTCGQHLEDIVHQYDARIREIMLTRTTQTNEPARCAVLLPSLAQLPQPLALLEVGASAGLCLISDRYGYDYGRARLMPSAAAKSLSLILPCEADQATPLPAAMPDIVWRRGLDLNPLDVNRDEDVAWLKTLVWPEQQHRLANLEAAIGIARLDPPMIERGDLLKDLPALASTAPKDATLVIFHTAVLSYLAAQEGRDVFADLVRKIGDVWISNEALGVFPEIDRQVSSAPKPGRFLLSVDGVPKAWTGPHGQSISWFG